MRRVIEEDEFLSVTGQTFKTSKHSPPVKKRYTRRSGQDIS